MASSADADVSSSGAASDSGVDSGIGSDSPDPCGKSVDPGVSWSSWSSSGYGSPGLVSVSVYKCLELLKDELA